MIGVLAELDRSLISGSPRTPGAVKGARFVRVHRSEAKTLDGEDGSISL